MNNNIGNALNGPFCWITLLRLYTTKLDIDTKGRHEDIYDIILKCSVQVTVYFLNIGAMSTYKLLKNRFYYLSSLYCFQSICDNEL